MRTPEAIRSTRGLTTLEAASSNSARAAHVIAATKHCAERRTRCRATASRAARSRTHRSPHNRESLARAVRRVVRCARLAERIRHGRARSIERADHGVRGALATLIRVDPEWERAIEAALGPDTLREAIVVESSSSIAAVRDLLGDSNGRASLLPLDTPAPSRRWSMRRSICLQTDRVFALRIVAASQRNQRCSTRADYSTSCPTISNLPVSA